MVLERMVVELVAGKIVGSNRMVNGEQHDEEGA